MRDETSILRCDEEETFDKAMKASMRDRDLNAKSGPRSDIASLDGRSKTSMRSSRPRCDIKGFDGKPRASMRDQGPDVKSKALSLNPGRRWISTATGGKGDSFIGCVSGIFPEPRRRWISTATRGKGDNFNAQLPEPRQPLDIHGDQGHVFFRGLVRSCFL